MLSLLKILLTKKRNVDEKKYENKNHLYSHNPDEGKIYFLADILVHPCLKNI